MALESWRRRAEELETEVYALYLAYRDARTPAAAKGVIGLLVAYAVSPVDPIPDVLPVVGYLDELVVVPLGVMLARRLVPDAVMRECRTQADEEMDVGRARWVVGAATLLAWVAFAAFAVRFVG